MRSYFIPTYFTLGGVAGGLLLIGGLSPLLHFSRGVAVTQLRDWLALPLLVVSAVLLTASLSHPRRVFRLLLSFRPTSVISWGTFILLGGALTSADLAVTRGSAHPPFIDFAAALLGAALCGYPGVALTTSSRRRWTTTPHLGGLFLSLGCSTAVTLSVCASPEGAGSRLLLSISLAAFAGSLLYNHLVELGRDFRDGRLDKPLPAPVPALLGTTAGLHTLGLLLLGPLALYTHSRTIRVVLALVILCGDLALRCAVFWLEEPPIL